MTTAEQGNEVLLNSHSNSLILSLYPDSLAHYHNVYLESMHRTLESNPSLSYRDCLDSLSLNLPKDVLDSIYNFASSNTTSDYDRMIKDFLESTASRETYSELDSIFNSTSDTSVVISEFESILNGLPASASDEELKIIEIYAKTIIASTRSWSLYAVENDLDLAPYWVDADGKGMA